MFLIQQLLPLDAPGKPLTEALLDVIVKRLVARFGGVTTYARSPAVGDWQGPAGARERDRVIIGEVMTDTLDPAWWSSWKTELQLLLDQESIVIRASECRIL
jgi:hypothetical protein